VIRHRELLAGFDGHVNERLDREGGANGPHGKPGKRRSAVTRQARAQLSVLDPDVIVLGLGAKTLEGQIDTLLGRLAF